MNAITKKVEELDNQIQYLANILEDVNSDLKISDTETAKFNSIVVEKIRHCEAQLELLWYTFGMTKPPVPERDGLIDLT